MAFPYPTGTDVRLVADFDHEDTVVEVHDGMAELHNGSLYLATELIPHERSDEQWLPLQGYENRYRLSNYGKLLSLSYRGKPRQRLLKAARAQENTVAIYRLPGIGKGAEGITFSAGQLVALHFLPPPPNERAHFVRYLDGNRRNLRWENLAWYDTTDTTDDAVNDYLKRGRGHGQTSAVLTVAQADEARVLITQKQKGTTYKTIAARYAVSEEVIKMLAKNGGLAKPNLSVAAKKGIADALRAGVPIGEIAKQHRIHRNTVNRLARELLAADEPATAAGR